MPAGIESDFSDDLELEAFKSISKKSNLTARMEDNVKEREERPKICWNLVKDEKAPPKMVSNYYLSELKPIKNLETSPTNLFEENLKRLILAEDIDGLKFLIEDDFDPDFCFSSKLSLISFSCYHHRKNVLIFLLDSGASISNPKSIPPIIALCSRKCCSSQEKENSLFILEILVKFGAPLDGTISNGQNCLHVAVKNENLHLLAAILKKNTDVHVKDAMGITPLNIAVGLNHKRAVKILLKNYTRSKDDVSELIMSAKKCSNFKIESVLQAFIDGNAFLTSSEDENHLNCYQKDESTSQNFRTREAVNQFLNAIGMPHLVATFSKYAINFYDLVNLKKDFLSSKLKLHDFEVEKIKSAIDELILNSYDKNSLFLGNQNSFSIIDICISIHNMNENFKLMNSFCLNLAEKIQIIGADNSFVLKEALSDCLVQLHSSHENLAETVKFLSFTFREENLPKDKSEGLVSYSNSEMTKFKLKGLVCVGIAAGSIILVLKHTLPMWI